MTKITFSLFAVAIVTFLAAPGILTLAAALATTAGLAASMRK